MSKPCREQSLMAGILAGRIKKLVYEYENMIPLALAIGVLHIVAKEIIDEQDETDLSDPVKGREPEVTSDEN